MDSRTIKAENLGKSSYQVPLGDVAHAYALGPSVTNLNLGS
jgi:hypothetical protein